MCDEEISFVLIFLSIIVQNGLLDYYILDIEDLTN